jgi:peptidoglycan/LPS O-acetylase OafA/YrhL
LGALRLFLALVVVVNHVWAPAENMLGFQAVVSFYILSGYLMTKVLHEVYGTDGDGVVRFLANRALRVFPPYWLFAGITLLLVMALPPSFSWGGMVQAPVGLLDWVSNVTFIDLTWAEGILIPPAWSLGIEVLFYIAMPLLLARSRRSVEIWAAISLLLTIALLVQDVGFGYRYYPAYAASLFFSVGALCHVHTATLRWLRLPMFLLWPTAIVLAALPVITEVIGLSHLHWAYYGGALLFVAILMTVIERPAATGLHPRLDRWLGDLAYPVFLGHFIAAGLVSVALGSVVGLGTVGFLGLTIVLTLVIAVAFALIIDPRIQRLRAFVRVARLPVRRGTDPVTVTH